MINNPWFSLDLYKEAILFGSSHFPQPTYTTPNKNRMIKRPKWSVRQKELSINSWQLMTWDVTFYLWLSGWWLNNPFEKYARQNGSLPQFSGWTSKNCLSCHHLVMKCYECCVFFYNRDYFISHELSLVIRVVTGSIALDLVFWIYKYAHWLIITRMTTETFKKDLGILN